MGYLMDNVLSPLLTMAISNITGEPPIVSQIIEMASRAHSKATDYSLVVSSRVAQPASSQVTAPSSLSLA